MKSLLFYYFLILAPIALFAYLVKTSQVTANGFIIYLIAYIAIYRPLTDFYRLRSRGVFENKDFWKVFKPGIHGKYFKELYGK